ncbi:MAG: PAS domain-containing sensor histidine kinase [Alphaproteobacteria bacterium]|nr:PAS domain-containing sensor histidine kinase [Alphaproteobacteria bacterium]
MASDVIASLEPLWKRFLAWARHHRLSRKLAYLLTAAALISGVATFQALNDATFGSSPRTVLVLLLIDLVILLLLGALIARRLVRLWVERRQGLAGSKLHTRLAALFSALAILPTIVVGIFSVLFFDLGLQSWFSERVRRVLTDSRVVAEAYVEEHRKTITAEVLAMANDIDRQAPFLIRDGGAFDEFVTGQALLRSLPEAIVKAGDGTVLARAPLSLVLEFEKVSDQAFERARRGEVVILANQTEDRVRAMVKLNRLVDAYLVVGRFVESRVLAHADRARGAAAAYERLEGTRSSIQITFAMVFLVVALLMLMVAVLVGLQMATRLSGPIGALVSATERARRGDLGVRVREGEDDDEIGTLSRAFNRMTGQLEGQRRDLIQANAQLEERRRFVAAVLSGVSAGVLGLDLQGRIELPNRSAATLLGMRGEELEGRPIEDAVPEMAQLVRDCRARPDRLAQGEIELKRQGRVQTLLVRVAAERGDAGEVLGYVVTFDDISDLLAAQRTAAWADVARRIAHEIKNPLTPIQLSAERLRRRYLPQLQGDPEIFQRCTDTIIRQVQDIGRMVDEFSSFARLPAPVFRSEDIGDLVRQATFLQQLANPQIQYRFELPAETVRAHCDGRQIAQALTNLLKNAAEAMEGRAEDGRIELRLGVGEGGVTIEVIDNGRGLPGELRDRLTEPYVTTRPRGTGLGLAIVRKIIEDHGGRLALDDAPGGGTLARLSWPAVPPAAARAAAETGGDLRRAS